LEILALHGFGGYSFEALLEGRAGVEPSGKSREMVVMLRA
jgi:hypothetical protein